MSRAVWKFVNANFETNYDFVKVVRGEFGQATATELRMDSGDGFSAVFKGNFVVDQGVATSGTVTGFDLYEGATRIVTAKGYSFSYADLAHAAEAADASDFAPVEALLDRETKFRGSPDDNSIYGSQASTQREWLLGKGGNDEMEGGGGNDRLKGGPGDDSLWLYHGHDRAVGGPGHDTFLFRDELGQIDVDKVKDFHPGEDIMQLGAFSFSSVLTPGELQATEFRVGAHAKDSNDFIVYQKVKGALYFDHDGVGGDAPVLFAKVDKGLDLTHSDFLVEVLG